MNMNMEMPTGGIEARQRRPDCPEWPCRLSYQTESLRVETSHFTNPE